MNPRQKSPRWRGPHHERQPAHQLIEYPSTLITDYGRERKKNVCKYPSAESVKRKVSVTDGERLFIFRVDTSEKWNMNGDEECATTAGE